MDQTPRPMVTRPLRWHGRVPEPDDLRAVQRVYRAFETARIGGPDSGDADLAAALQMRDVDRDETSLVLDGDDVAGSVYVAAEARTKDVFVDLAAVPGPAEPAALALGVQHGAAAARRIVAGRGEPGWTLRVGCWTTDPELPALLGAQGLAPVRRFYRMRIDSTSPAIPASPPPLPPGVDLVVRDDEATRQALWEVDNGAFLDHWNFAPSSYDEWWDDFSVGDTRDPDGWWLLTVDGAPAAICLLDESRAEVGDGYVSVLGVRRRFRGRGLATLLLQRAFVRYRDLGRAGTQLGVDAENTTGAVALYERVGMTAQRVIQSWARDLP